MVCPAGFINRRLEKPANGFNYGVLRYMVEDKTGNMTLKTPIMGFNYLGSRKRELYTKDFAIVDMDIGEAVGWIRNDIPLLIDAYIQENEMVIEFVCIKEVVQEVEFKKIIRVIEEYLKNLN